MPERPEAAADRGPPRPIPETYWVAPGRLLVGEHPGSHSRAEAMERLRRFLQAGVTCFVDLTEARELPSYEALLPFATPGGRRIEYLREPIPDHGVPESAETMLRVLALVDDALEAGHVVYVHCRAGVGRSATVAGCWLASRRPAAEAFDELQRCWRQSARSAVWTQVPETDEQVAWVKGWSAPGVRRPLLRTARALDTGQRARGAMLGLALGDAEGSGRATAGKAEWSQHTALTLCLSESLLERGRLDARDLVERFLRWQRDGHPTASGRPETATPDVARALATYQWRGQPMAGSHDPRDRSTAGLPRILAAALYEHGDAAAAVHLAGECVRITHQSPFVIDTCRYYGAMLWGALSGRTPAEVLEGVFEPAPGFWAARPLKPMVATMARAGVAAADPHAKRPAAADAVQALARARAAVAAAADFDDALARVRGSAVEPALESALAGTLFGALYGPDALPQAGRAAIARRELLESLADRLVTASNQRLPGGGAA